MRPTPPSILVVLLFCAVGCAGQAWRVLPSGYGPAASPPPRRLGPGVEAEAAEALSPAHAPSRAADPTRQAQYAVAPAPLPARLPRPQLQPVAVLRGAPYAQVGYVPTSRTVREPNGDTVTTTRSVTEQALPLLRGGAAGGNAQAYPAPEARALAPLRSPVVEAAPAPKPSPPPPKVAAGESVPQPLDLVAAHQAAMATSLTGSGGVRFQRSSTPPPPPPPAQAAPAAVQAQTLEGSPPAVHSHVFGLSGLRFWSFFWFALLAACMCANVLSRRLIKSAAARDGEAVTPLVQHTQHTQRTRSSKDSHTGYGALLPEHRKERRGARGSSRTRRAEAGGASEGHDGAPEEYMMQHLGAGAAPKAASSSRSQPGSSRSERSRAHKGAVGTAALPGKDAPPWETLYRDAPDVATTHANDLLRTLSKGRKVLVERSWCGEAGAAASGRAPMPKVSVSVEKGGVGLCWQDARFGPTTRVLLHSASAALDSLAVVLETQSGPMSLHPTDVVSRATWVLALNAAFHAYAMAAPGGWAVGKSEMESAVIGLPWHPAVFLAANQSVGVAAAAHARGDPQLPPKANSVLDAL